MHDVRLDLPEFGLPGAVGDPELVCERIRVYVYAIKFIARLTGRKKAE